MRLDRRGAPGSPTADAASQRADPAAEPPRDHTRKKKAAPLPRMQNAKCKMQNPSCPARDRSRAFEFSPADERALECADDGFPNNPREQWPINEAHRHNDQRPRSGLALDAAREQREE